VRHDSLDGISDEAIEECFPPSDSDLAEIECMEQYINLLCHLDALESYDEYHRKHGHLEKRWAARRSEGLLSGSSRHQKVVDTSSSRSSGSASEDLEVQLVGSPNHRVFVHGVDFSFQKNARNVNNKHAGANRRIGQPGGRSGMK
jgi:hypothetical protein